MSRRSALYIDLLAESDDEERRVRQRVDPSQAALLVRPAPTPSVAVALEREQVNRFVGVLWLAQALVAPTTVCHLVAGGRAKLPANQQGVIERDIFTRVVVRPDLATLAASDVAAWASPALRQAAATFTIAHRDDGVRATPLPEFRLTCRFVVGERTRIGRRATPERVPLVVQRQGADAVPWQTYNPAVHTEEPGKTRGAVVSFIDAPNVLLHGDAFYLSTSSTHELNEIGQSPAEQIELSGASEERDSRAHFYDDTLLDAFARTGASLHGIRAEQLAASGSSVNIELFDAPPMTLERFQSAQQTVGAMTTTAQLEAAVRTVLVDRRAVI